MGIDFLDFAFAIERQFGVRLDVADLLDDWRANGNDCTVGRLHEIVCDKCRKSGLPVPRSSWNRIRIALANSLGCKVSQITPGAYWRRELGFN